MAHLVRQRYANYVNLLNEVKEIEHDGGINLDANPPMMPDRVDGIKLQLFPQQRAILYLLARSEERRVGKECRSGWSTYH